jgi:hypothetical protein
MRRRKGALVGEGRRRRKPLHPTAGIFVAASFGASLVACGG